MLSNNIRFYMGIIGIANVIFNQVNYSIVFYKFKLVFTILTDMYVIAVIIM
jgi:hypothetical protein